MARTLLKAGAERLLVHSGLGRVGRVLFASRTLVLAYHNIVPRGQSAAGDRSLHIPQEIFSAQLDVLTRTHTIVPLSEVLDQPTGAPGKPRIAITFDDAYRGAVTAGVDELARRGLPVTIFVAPKFIDGGTFWWDVFSNPQTGGLPQGFREHALLHLQGDDVAVREWAAAVGHRAYTVAHHATVASEAELQIAVQHPGITLGSHTWGHRNMAALDDAALEDELVRPLAWLRDRFDPVVPWISYPYGLFSPKAEEAVGRAGYSGALRVDGGWIRRAEVRTSAVPRLNIPAGLSTRGFALRVSGIL